MCEDSSVTITDEMFNGKNELFCSFYKCPNCNSADIIKEMRFCPSCGKKIIWNCKHNEEIYDERGATL